MYKLVEVVNTMTQQAINANHVLLTVSLVIALLSAHSATLRLY